ncbi:MAG: PAS domain S-box protein, partial [Bacteroidia bacterium]|nr:PAS domain S-box protein [Bacteroidia bacterium]
MEEDRQAQLRVLKHMDQINHIIQDTTDLNQLLKDVMNAVMEIFESDRAWLLYPCDPDHPTYRVPAECSRPEYPGAFILNEDIPMKPGTDDVCRAVLASADPVPYGPAFEHKIYPELTSQFGVQAQLVTAIYPMTGKPWMFGIHQCSHARKWTPQDIHIFKDIGRRLADGLSSMLFLSELQKSEEKFSYFVKNSNDIFVLIDENGKEIFVSDSVELITGFTPAETMGHSGFEFLHPDDINHMSKTLSKLLETPGGTIRDEYRHRRKGGGWIHLEAIGTNYLHEPLVGGIILNVRDITERKQAEKELKQKTQQLTANQEELTNLYTKSEESRKSLLSILEDVNEKEQALRKSEEKFKTVADFTYSWEYWIDTDRNFIYISPSCERISGYKPEEFFKDPELLEKIIYPDDKEKVINHKKIKSDSKKAANVDFRIITRNGDIRCIEHVCRLVYGKDGKYLGRRATNRDITDNRRQETIRQMMYQISNAVNTTKDLNEFFKVIHLELGKVLKTKNFYIALYNKETDTLSLPYFIDEKDNFNSFPARKTLTAYVIKNNKPVILTEKDIKKLISSGEIESVGTVSKIWLGVPLISKEEVIGVLAVQSYENEKDFDKKDLELLKFISGQIGLSIERKQSEDFIRIQRDIAMELNDVTSVDETLRVCLDACIRISGMDCGGIYLVNKDTGNLDLALHKGLPENFVKSASHFDAGSNNARLVMAGKAVYSQHQKLDVDINNNRKQENLRAIAVIPVLHEGKVIACLNIASHFYDVVPANARIALQTIAAQIGNVIARINTAKELKDSEEKYRQVVDNSLVGNYISQNYILKFCNQQLIEIFGYNNADEMLEKDMREIITSESREFEYSEVKLRKPGEKDFSRYEFKGIKKDSSLIDVEVLGGRILYEGKPAMQGTLIDITERKKYEEELKIAKEKAEESDRLKSVFLSTMSHELRTPLNAIIGFSELIDESLPMDVITDFSETINDSGTHLLNIIEDVFDISTLETGDMKVIKEEFSLTKAIKEVSDSIKAEQKKEKKECLNIYFYPDKKVQDPEVFTDKHKLKQIMINLLKNAIKFTLEGHIEYGYEIEDEKNILFFVKDTGVGIPKDKQEIIFDRFRQADDSHTRKFGGTGLG